MKKYAWTCPKCGEEVDTEGIDMELDIEYLCQKMICRKCSHTWREFFKIKYDGYADDSGIYSADGEKESD